MESVRNYFKPSADVRARDLVREFFKQGGFLPGMKETAKAIPRDMARFGISAMEAPKSIRTGAATGKYYNTPLGRINSFQSEAQNRVNRGDPMWKAMGNPMMDTVLAGSDIGSIAGLGAKALRPMSALARDMSNPVGHPFESSFMQGVSHPGLSLSNEAGSFGARPDLRPLNYPYPSAANPKLTPTPAKKFFAPEDVNIDDVGLHPGHKPFPKPFRALNASEEQMIALKKAGYEFSPETRVWRPQRAGTMEPGKELRMNYGDMKTMQAPESISYPDNPEYSQLLQSIGKGQTRIRRPDFSPVNPRPFNQDLGDIEQTLINAGYRSDRLPLQTAIDAGGSQPMMRRAQGPGSTARTYDLWKLKNRKAWNEFNENPRVETMDEMYDPEVDSVRNALNGIDDGDDIEDALNEGWSLADIYAGGNYMRRNGRITANISTDNLLPESYGQDITDDFSRSWQGGSPSFRPGKGREFYNDIRPEIKAGTLDKWSKRVGGDYISRQDLKKNPDKIYLFGDNLLRKGLGGQAKEMRGEPNAIGIPTKKAPHMGESAFMSDADFESNKKAIDAAFSRIPSGKEVVIPKSGLGTGLARLKEKAPKTFEYLQKKLDIIRTSKK